MSPSVPPSSTPLSDQLLISNLLELSKPVKETFSKMSPNVSTSFVPALGGSCDALILRVSAVNTISESVKSASSASCSVSKSPPMFESVPAVGSPEDMWV